MLCFVSLRVDLPTVWHGLGLWEQCGSDELHFSIYYCLLCLFCNLFVGLIWHLPLWLVLGVLHRSAGAQHKIRSAGRASEH